MTDAKFDFQANDIVISNGGVELVSLCSQQNAMLIFSKSAASLTKPQFGVGFEDFYPLLPKWAWGKVEATAEKQIYDDGALIARVNIFEETASGVVTADIHARYKE